MITAKVIEEKDQKCWNCDKFIPTNEFTEENPSQGYCKLDPKDRCENFYQYHYNLDSCDKNPNAWAKRRLYHPTWAYGCINQCPNCGRWTYFIHDMNIDDLFTENEGFCSYCGFTQVEDY